MVRKSRAVGCPLECQRLPCCSSRDALSTSDTPRPGNLRSGPRRRPQSCISTPTPQPALQNLSLRTPTEPDRSNRPRRHPGKAHMREATWGGGMITYANFKFQLLIVFSFTD